LYVVFLFLIYIYRHNYHLCLSSDDFRFYYPCGDIWSLLR